MAACMPSVSYSADTRRPKLQSPKSFKPSQLSYFFLPQTTKIRAARFRCCRTSSVFRAGSAERENMPTDVRRRAMNAIESSRRRVTIGGFVSKSTPNSNEAQKALQALAAETSGFIEVSDEGEVLYVFPKGAKSIRKIIDSVLEKGKMVAATVVRVSFGISFVASSVFGILGLASNLLLCDRAEQVRIFDRFGTLCSGRFIEKVFSLVFGDGDPNQGIEEKRWKMIGQYIALNGGVVTAEEIAPFLDPETIKKMDDESYMLPVLLRFDGQPKVDEQGYTMYHFPSIQCFAAGKQVQKFFKEKEWEFSKVDGKEVGNVFYFLSHNLFWSMVLGGFYWALEMDGSIKLSFMSYIFLPLLRMYAIFVGSFFVIATCRWFAYRERNAEVVKRNKAREQLAKALELPDLSLKQKILSARSMAGVWENERREWDRRFKERWDFDQ